jgi:hypothetical protein
MRAGTIPLEVTARVSARWRDGDFYMVRVIERRKRDPARSAGGPLKGGVSDFEYYVHYEQCALPRLAAALARADVRWTLRALCLS